MTEAALTEDQLMNEAWDAMEQEGAPDDAVAAVAAPEKQENSEDLHEAVASEEKAAKPEKKGGRKRDAQGQFAANEDKPPEQAADAPPVETKSADAETSAGQETAVPSIQPPASLSAAAKAEWDKAPRAIQQDMLKREADMSRYMQQVSPQLKQLDAINQLIAPQREEFEHVGGVEKGLGMLLELNNFARKDPEGYAAWFMQKAGVEPQRLLNRLASGAGAQPAYNPQLAALQQEVSSLKSQYQSERERQQAAVTQQANAEIESFFANPKNVHAEQVRADMAALLESGMATNLQDAYERAVWGRADIRAQLVAQQTAAAEAQRREAAQKQADAARKASNHARATQGGVANTAPLAKTEDELMNEVWDRLHGG